MAATVTVTLVDGIDIGGETHREVVLREATAGDVLDAQEEAERLVYTPGSSGGMEPALVTSPSRVGVEVLRRQVVSVGDVSGPVDLKMMRRLSPQDLNTLLERAEALDGAAVSAVEGGTNKRGRGDGDRSTNAEGDVGDRNVDRME
ncbi:phage tail assembly protein [Thioalkalivibrio sp. ALMg9]|uniref:phage tail assembly protein n=1 Tax=Thioalkalivibrio sp. ALMg9 TaxID=1266912 RepID=UPI00037421EF|nr:phage tail assembly protein [Thioalkalivibrio sp. ALMg9]